MNENRQALISFRYLRIQWRYIRAADAERASIRNIMSSGRQLFASHIVMSDPVKAPVYEIGVEKIWAPACIPRLAANRLLT